MLTAYCGASPISEHHGGGSELHQVGSLVMTDLQPASPAAALAVVGTDAVDAAPYQALIDELGLEVMGDEATAEAMSYDALTSGRGDMMAAPSAAAWVAQCVQQLDQGLLVADLPAGSGDEATLQRYSSPLTQAMIAHREQMVALAQDGSVWSDEGGDDDHSIAAQLVVDARQQERISYCTAEYVKAHSLDHNMALCGMKLAGCGGMATQGVPGPHHSDRLIFRWYEPFLDPAAGLDSADYPPAFSTERRKAVVIVHGWLGWSKDTFRQKLRFFHNAKEDVLYGGSGQRALMGPTGLDLTFTFVTGKPNANDLGAMLQCAPHADSTVAQGQTSLIEFLDHSGRGGCNLEDSYNVGWVDWTQIAYNRSVEDTEKSLWVPSHAEYLTDEAILTLLQDMVAELPWGTELSFIGHSLGAGLAIRMQHVFMQGVQDGSISAGFYGSQLILADPYFSNFGMLPYDSWYWPGRRARQVLKQTAAIVKNLRTQKEWQDAVTEWSRLPQDYQALSIVATRDDQTEMFGDENRPLKFDNSESVYIELGVKSIQQDLQFTRSQFPRAALIFHALDNIIYTQVAQYHRRHVYPLFWILDRMGRQAAMTQAEVLRITSAAGGGGWYKQTAGADTIETMDDEIEFNVHVR